jgi:hypothetical protein
MPVSKSKMKKRKRLAVSRRLDQLPVFHSWARLLEFLTGTVIQITGTDEKSI